MRSFSTAKKLVMKEQLDELVQKKIIKKLDANDYPNYVSNVHLVKDGHKEGGYRITGDYKWLNLWTKKSVYPLPAMHEIFFQLSGLDRYIALDISKAFFHAEMDHESSMLTTFTTPFGLYRYLRMPNGIINGPPWFQAYMDEILQPLKKNQPTQFSEIKSLSNNLTNEIQEAIKRPHDQQQQLEPEIKNEDEEKRIEIKDSELNTTKKGPQAKAQRIWKSKDYITIINYIDDLLMGEKGPDSELKLVLLLAKVLAILREHCIRMKITKCYFNLIQVEFLGRVINRFGIQLNEKWSNKIMKCPVPRTRDDLSSFLGMFNTLCANLPHYSEFIIPFQDIRSTKSKYLWTADHQIAFERIKEVVQHIPTLYYPDLSSEGGRFWVFNDSSSKCIGGALFQQVDVKKLEKERDNLNRPNNSDNNPDLNINVIKKKKKESRQVPQKPRPSQSQPLRSSKPKKPRPAQSSSQPMTLPRKSKVKGIKLSEHKKEQPIKYNYPTELDSSQRSLYRDLIRSETFQLQNDEQHEQKDPHKPKIQSTNNQRLQVKFPVKLNPAGPSFRPKNRTTITDHPTIEDLLKIKEPPKEFQDVENYKNQGLVPIAFNSKVLNSTQQQWHISEQELFSITENVAKWHDLIYDKLFIIVTDHLNLCDILNYNKLLKSNQVSVNARLCRQVNELQKYYFIAIHKGGISKFMKIPDYLSRCVNHDLEIEEQRKLLGLIQDPSKRSEFKKIIESFPKQDNKYISKINELHFNKFCSRIPINYEDPITKRNIRITSWNQYTEFFKKRSGNDLRTHPIIDNDDIRLKQPRICLIWPHQRNKDSRSKLTNSKPANKSQICQEIHQPNIYLKQQLYSINYVNLDSHIKENSILNYFHYLNQPTPKNLGKMFKIMVTFHKLRDSLFRRIYRCQKEGNFAGFFARLHELRLLKDRYIKVLRTVKIGENVQDKYLKALDKIDGLLLFKGLNTLPNSAPFTQEEIIKKTSFVPISLVRKARIHKLPRDIEIDPDLAKKEEKIPQ